MSDPGLLPDGGASREPCFRRNDSGGARLHWKADTVQAFWPVLLLVVLLCMGSGGSFGVGAPRFSWGAFQRFWNTSAVLGAEIRAPQPVAEGYLVSYGSSANLVVLAKGDMVSGVRAEFIEAPGNEPGGRLFLKAVDSAIRVGTYRWPEERRRDVFRKFESITPQLVRYEWKTSRFTRERRANGMWIFTLEFVEDRNPQAGQ